MHRTGDLLHQLADEHRDLAAASRGLCQLGRNIGRDALRCAATRIVEHELAHRLLVHPLLHREAWGRRIFADRREEQLLLAERLRRALAPARASVTRGVVPDDVTFDVTEALDLQLTEHTDREEILEFPHLRHVTTFAELSALGELRGRLRDAIQARLAADPTLLEDGRWASAPREELLEVLELDEDIVIDLPAAERAAAGGVVSSGR